MFYNQRRQIIISLLPQTAVSSVVDSAAVRDDSKAGHPKGYKGYITHSNNCAPRVLLVSPSPSDLWPSGPARQVFVPESEASNFFKRRSRRSPRSYAELQGNCFNICFPPRSLDNSSWAAVTCQEEIVLSSLLKVCHLTGSKPAVLWVKCFVCGFKWVLYLFVFGVACGWLVTTSPERFMWPHLRQSEIWPPTEKRVRVLVCRFVAGL